MFALWKVARLNGVVLLAAAPLVYLPLVYIHKVGFTSDIRPPPPDVTLVTTDNVIYVLRESIAAKICKSHIIFISIVAITFCLKLYNAQRWKKLSAQLVYFQRDLEVPAVSKHIDRSACL